MVLRGFLLMGLNKCSDKKEEYYVGITAFKAESLIPAMRRRSLTQLNTKANLSESTTHPARLRVQIDLVFKP